MSGDGDKQYFATYGLKRCLEEAYASSSPANRVEIYRKVAQIIESSRQSTRSVPMRDRPDKEHSVVDAKIQQLGLPAMSTCRKGCAACCHITVMVTNSEAKQLAGLISSGEVPVDMDRLREQAAFVGSDYDYAVQPPEKNRCVFLGSDNACRVYEKRPTSCRKYLVRSDPAICHEGPGGVPEIISSIEIESMATGFADLDRNAENMAKSLLRYLEQK